MGVFTRGAGGGAPARAAPSRRQWSLYSGDTTSSFRCHQCHWWVDLLSQEYKVRRRLHPRRPRRVPSENSAARSVVFMDVSKCGAGGVRAAHPEPSGRIPDFVLLWHSFRALASPVSLPAEFVVTGVQSSSPAHRLSSAWAFPAFRRSRKSRSHRLSPAVGPLRVWARSFKQRSEAELCTVVTLDQWISDTGVTTTKKRCQPSTILRRNPGTGARRRWLLGPHR